MFPVHCNVCFKNRDSEHALQLQLGRCHHIICVGCMPKPSDGRKCLVCNRQFYGVPITLNMADKMAKYFEDPTIFLKTYGSISKFQHKQRAIYYHHFYQLQAEIANKKRKIHGYMKLETQLCQQNDIEKKRIAELRDYIAYYERPNDASFSSSDTSTTRRTCRPRTPSLSATDSTLTDNESDLADEFILKEFKKQLSQAKSLKSARKLKKKT